VSVRFVCPSSGTLTITGLALEDQHTLKALHAPPLPLVTRFKPQQVVEVTHITSHTEGHHTDRKGGTV
jgi:hypothetical protein